MSYTQRLALAAIAEIAQEKRTRYGPTDATVLVTALSYESAFQGN